MFSCKAGEVAGWNSTAVIVAVQVVEKGQAEAHLELFAAWLRSKKL